MKHMPIIIICLLIALIPSSAGSWGPVMMSGGVTATPAGFCAGTELFCEDFEGTDVTWDAAVGTVDVNVDTDGDYSDDVTATHNAVLGDECFGIRGAVTNYVQETLTTKNLAEYYYEYWYRVSNNQQTFDGGPCIITDAGYVVIGIINNWGNLYYATLNGATWVDTTADISNTTWYHLGVYFNAATSGANGTVRVWMNTDGGTFDAADIKYTSTTVNTGTVAGGYGADAIQLQGPEATFTNWVDDMKIIAGACPWAYE